MRLGLIARADNTGLGHQTWELYRHLNPHKTLVVDISHLKGNQLFPERYPDAKVVKGFPTVDDFAEFLDDLDVVFTCEIPYGYVLFELAEDMGVKTNLQCNPRCSCRRTPWPRCRCRSCRGSRPRSEWRRCGKHR